MAKKKKKRYSKVSIETIKKVIDKLDETTDNTRNMEGKDVGEFEVYSQALENQLIILTSLRVLMSDLIKRKQEDS